MVWLHARIIEGMPSADEKVRAVKLQTAIGRYVRPTTKICLLPNQKLHPFSNETNNFSLYTQIKAP